MASKSKRRRRVFRASCILAALIIAGSSFAWFTSKDEVTNRLSASSDYGVSIVESFAPPKNWLPGEDVNKDVYAVNTGNIDAFVKENIHGVLNYTYEDVVADFGTDGKKYVELTLDQVKAIQGQNTSEDGFKTYEAGGYLAWTNAREETTTKTKTYTIDSKSVNPDTTVNQVAYADDSDTATPKTFTVSCVDPDDANVTYYAENDDNGAALYTLTNGYNVGKVYSLVLGKTLSKTETTDTVPVEVGSINEGRTQDISSPWTPTETGVYVFRRSINKASETEPFTYSGYYFDKDTNKYYKIVLGSDTYPAAERKEVVVGGKTRVDFVYDIYADASDIVGSGNQRDDNFIDQDTGKINTDVGYMFVVEEEKNDEDVTFTMDEANHRLIAEYTIAYAGDGTYDANATLARAQVDYENARGAYDAAKASYDNAVANQTYGKALADAEQTLYRARVALENAYKAVNSTDTSNPGAKKQWEDARDDVNNWATEMDDGSYTGTLTGFKANGIRDLTADTTATNELADGIAALRPTSVTGTPAGIMPDEVIQATNGTPAGNPYVAALNDSNSAFSKAFKSYSDIYKEIYGNEMDGNGGLYKDVTDALATVKSKSNKNSPDNVTDTGSAAAAKTASATLKTKAAELEKKMKELQAAYMNFIDAKNLVTGMDTSDATDTAGMTALSGMVTVATDFSDNADELDKLVDTYVKEEKEYNEAKQALEGKKDDWKEAVRKYNTTVTDAKTAYNSEVDSDGITSAKEANTAANAWDANNFQHEFEDLNDTLVPAYSAVNGTGATDPAFAGPESDNDSVLSKVLAFDGSADYTWPDGVSVRDLDGSTTEDKDPVLTDTDFSTKDYIGAEDNAARAAVTTARTVSGWKNEIDKAGGYKEKLATAKKAYDAATAQYNNGSTLKFYVNLDSHYADYWQFDTNTDKTADPTFYYRYVLEAGETSHKLIDSVEFDKDVSAGAYKDMTFDLNVGLDSAQVTYDDNQRLYETDAVDGNNAFVLKVTNPTTAFDADTQLTWGTPATT